MTRRGLDLAMPNFDTPRANVNAVDDQRFAKNVDTYFAAAHYRSNLFRSHKFHYPEQIDSTK